MEQRLILINLLVKLGVAAAAASILVRSVEFKSLLFREERNLQAKNLSRFVDRYSPGSGRLDPLQREKFSGRRSVFRDRHAAGRDWRTLAGCWAVF